MKTSLAEINQKILLDGQQFPTVKLKDGTQVQTGTFATLVHNIGLYNASPSLALRHEIENAIPTLIKVGLFDLFPPAQWVGQDNPGKQLVAELAMAALADQT